MKAEVRPFRHARIQKMHPLCTLKELRMYYEKRMIRPREAVAPRKECVWTRRT